MSFSDIKSEIEEKADGRSFTASQHARWQNNLRKAVARDPLIRGFHGLFFLFKEATVSGGSTAEEGRYKIPDDFVSDLNVFYNEALLSKAPPQILDITKKGSYCDSGTPYWWRMMGLEIELIPPPDAEGNEIKLLYQGVPDIIPSSSNDDFEDYFMNAFPDLHIFGGASKACLSIGDQRCGSYYMDLYDKEVQKLGLGNRQHWLKNTHIRFQTWDEFEEHKTILFPQFGNVS